MMRALFSAASGMTAQQMNVDNIANNLANANTNGYKIAARRSFRICSTRTSCSRAPPPASRPLVPAGLQLGLGTRASSNEIIFTQGTFSQTDNPLDVAIQGHGFFQVRLTTGNLAYTRDGSFQLDKNGNPGGLASGNPLEPQITIPANAQSVTIAPTAR